MKFRFVAAVCLAASGVLTSGAAAQAAEVTIVHAGRLLAVPGEAVQENMSVVIRDGRVDRILEGFVAASDVPPTEDENVVVHDLSAYFVMPGLIDGHVHITSENNPQGRLQRVQMSGPDRAMLGALYARRSLMAGFTTVRDVGAGDADAVFALRNGIARGYVPGPRLFASGKTVTPTGGHADGSQGYRDDLRDVLASEATCDGADECRKKTRDQIRGGADHIKITATGGVLSNTAAGTGQQFFTDELEAIVQSAHMMGRKVTAHAHGVDGINAALRAGVDSIEHGTYLNDESIRLFKRGGAYYVPTALAGHTVAEWAADPNTFLTPAQRDKAARVGPQMTDALRRAHRGGVKIAFGTDSGVSRHGENAREFALMIEAGMSPEDAIIAATVNGADNLGRADELGTLEPGKWGDLIAVDGDPLDDISELSDVDFVMKGGRAYKTPGVDR